MQLVLSLLALLDAFQQFSFELVDLLNFLLLFFPPLLPKS